MEEWKNCQWGIQLTSLLQTLLPIFPTLPQLRYDKGFRQLLQWGLPWYICYGGYPFGIFEIRLRNMTFSRALLTAAEVGRSLSVVLWPKTRTKDLTSYIQSPLFLEAQFTLNGECRLVFTSHLRIKTFSHCISHLNNVGLHFAQDNVLSRAFNVWLSLSADKYSCCISWSSSISQMTLFEMVSTSGAYGDDLIFASNICGKTYLVIGDPSILPSSIP